MDNISDKRYDEYRDRLRTAALLRNASEVLEVDSMFHLPKKSADLRSEQMSAMQAMIHRLTTDESYAKLLGELEGSELDADRRANVRISVRDFVRSAKVPERLVKEMAEAQSLANGTYYEAREKSDFSLLAPRLEKLVALAREYAGIIGGNTPYDALLGDYDHGLTQEKLDSVFSQVRERLIPTVRAIYADRDRVDPMVFENPSKEKNLRLFKELLAEIGFDLDRGSIRESPSGFMIGHSADTRIFFRNTDLIGMVGTTMHEG